MDIRKRKPQETFTTKDDLHEQKRRKLGDGSATMNVLVNVVEDRLKKIELKTSEFCKTLKENISEWEKEKSEIEAKMKMKDLYLAKKLHDTICMLKELQRKNEQEKLRWKEEKTILIASSENLKEQVENIALQYMTATQGVQLEPTLHLDEVDNNIMEAYGNGKGLNDSTKYSSKVAKAKCFFQFRKGKWHDVETEYFKLLVLGFQQGILNIVENYPCRIFLAHALACDPMRISKKFVGDKQIGKQRFVSKPPAYIAAYDTNALKKYSEKIKCIQKEFQTLLVHNIRDKPVDNGLWAFEEEILTRVLWPSVVTKEEINVEEKNDENHNEKT